MSYDLRRLRLHGLIERLPGTHRYRLTTAGLRYATFLTRVHRRLLQPTLAAAFDAKDQAPQPIRAAMSQLERVIDDHITRSSLAA